MTHGMPSPFTIHIAEERLRELRCRLDNALWPGDFGNEDGHHGLQQQVLQEIVAYWREQFDWREVEAEINRLPHFKVMLDDVPIHFVHVRSGAPDAIPLILSHGWPWTFWDWRHVIDLLSSPTPGGRAFDLVIPSLPGYAFSTPLRTPGIDVPCVAKLWRTLMRDVLGYSRFAAAGGDWGSMITAQIGHQFPEDVIGVHLTLPLLPGVALEELLEADFPTEEQWMAKRMVETRPVIMSHIVVQSTDPQTLAYALNDSPLGLAAWLWERRLAWSDPRQKSAARDARSLCTLASLYWLTDSVASSLRIYSEQARQPWARIGSEGKVIEVPTAFALAPKELVFAPRAAINALVNLKRWTVLPRGGHFVPAEAPEELVGEYRLFFGDLA